MAAIISKDSDPIVSDTYPTCFLLETDLLWNLAVKLPFFLNLTTRSDSNKSVMGSVSALKKNLLKIVWDPRENYHAKLEIVEIHLLFLFQMWH